MRMTLIAGAALTATLAAAALAGCGTTAETPPAEGGPVRCNAAASQSLVGQNLAATDFAPGSTVRVVCTTCAATDDYRPERLNVRYNAETGIIEKVDCG